MSQRPLSDASAEADFRRADDLYDDGQLLAAFDLLVALATLRDEWLSRARERLLDVAARLRIAYAESPREAQALEQIVQLLERNSYNSPDVRKKLRLCAREIITDEILRTGWGHALTDRDPSETVSRTPHIDLLADGPLRPGERFKVVVYLDREMRRTGETGQDVVAPSGSLVEIELLTSSHFTVMGSPKSLFRIDSDSDRQELPPFDLSCVDRSLWADDAPSIVSMFYVDGRPCGKVGRMIDVVDAPSGRIDGEDEASVRIGANGLSPADLTVTVVADPENDGRHYWCSISTPHLPAYERRVTERWNLPQAARDLVVAHFREFTADGTSRAQTVAELSGAGVRLFEAAPPIFQKVIWELIDAKIEFSSIAIVSQEPYMPWELMIPSRITNGRHEDRAMPLGVEFDVGRWTDDRIIAPPRQIRLSDSHVIAPTYSGKRALDEAAAEAAMVIANYPGNIVTPADFETIESALGTSGRSLIHFVCHGEDDQSGIQCIHLEAGGKLTSSSVIRMRGIADRLATTRPVVFLNACEVGRGAPALVGLGGFAPAFIRLGAAAVIAPVWSVDDADAHQVARDFYAALKTDRNIPISKIIARIRAKAYDKDLCRDSFAAYCFYGDPCAIVN